MVGHQPGKPARVCGDLPGETGVAGEGGQPTGGFGGGGPGQLLVLVLVGHGQEVFAAGEGLFGFDLGAEPAAAGSCVALKHLDGMVAVLQGPGDDAAGAAGDVPGQRAAELPGGQRPGCRAGQGDDVSASGGGAVGGDPVGEVG